MKIRNFQEYLDKTEAIRKRRSNADKCLKELQEACPHEVTREGLLMLDGSAGSYRAHTCVHCGQEVDNPTPDG